MKTYPPIDRQPARHVRVPAFIPVRLRRRADGWTPRRQAAFLAFLAQSRSVSAAARRVGMARESAYRLRARAEATSFAAAWDKVTGRVDRMPRKVTPGELAYAAIHGRLKPLFYRGEHVATVPKADVFALLRCMGRMDRARLSTQRGGGRSQSFAVRPACTPQSAGWSETSILPFRGMGTATVGGGGGGADGSRRRPTAAPPPSALRAATSPGRGGS